MYSRRLEAGEGRMSWRVDVYVGSFCRCNWAGGRAGIMFGLPSSFVMDWVGIVWKSVYSKRYIFF